MARLKDRQRQIPGGYKMRIPAFKYQSPPFPSFDSLVRDVYRLVSANPKLAAQNGLPTDYHKVEQWVDSYNADICDRNGWTTYISLEGGATPKWIAPTLLRQLGESRVVAGAKTLLSWLGNGADPVPRAMAEKRALTCASCPMNRQTKLSDIFIRSVSVLIRRQVEFAKECGLSTTADNQIGICDACSCPLKLMVHVPLYHKLSQLDKETYDKLPEHCWVVREKAIMLQQQVLATVQPSDSEG